MAIQTQAVDHQQQKGDLFGRGPSQCSSARDPTPESLPDWNEMYSLLTKAKDLKIQNNFAITVPFWEWWKEDNSKQKAYVISNRQYKLSGALAIDVLGNNP